MRITEQQHFGIVHLREELPVQATGQMIMHDVRWLRR